MNVRPTEQQAAPPTGARCTVDAVRAAVRAVPDPELPPVTIGMLGMVHHLDVDDDGRVVVELLPTYSGCPATQMIERDVTEAVRALPGVTDVHVRFRFDPPWHPERIDDEGRQQLRRFGIAPPVAQVTSARAVAPEGRRTLPLLAQPRACPYCGSRDTALDSAFGPTPCRDLRFCAACQQPFEAFR